MHGGNPKADQLSLLKCPFSTGSTCSPCQRRNLSVPVRCKSSPLTRTVFENLRWKRPRAGNLSRPLPPPTEYLLLYASAVWFKKGQRLLASYVKHISPNPACLSDPSCMLFSSASLPREIFMKMLLTVSTGADSGLIRMQQAYYIDHSIRSTYVRRQTF